MQGPPSKEWSVNSAKKRLCSLRDDALYQESSVVVGGPGLRCMVWEGARGLPRELPARGCWKERPESGTGCLWKFRPEPPARDPKCGPPGDAPNMDGLWDCLGKRYVRGGMPAFWASTCGPHFLAGKALFRVGCFGPACGRSGRVGWRGHLRMVPMRDEDERYPREISMRDADER